ncbi:isoleucine--tRNA ligase [Calidifontibacter sp. DB0510]|uniref:Isoleucine--tRNA ligase n=1 Tax=Metallococcus carri TaxID=1656884 RepID=A0A967AZD0_9MICO|nr:isoleucine--tRNA ligase [Metallococcus carri]NHN55896.1 isoleucine--tRNA ligase [Metallococcus carri]NOP38416.1 isoleucine--tRNA ligase [Calidifontibacter sp. DB2511S]
MSYPKVDLTAADPAQSAGVTPSPNFPQIEQAVRRYWDEDGTFLASIAQRDAGVDGSNEFVFYDGPPFANGLPHYGHLLTGYAKDLIPRYQTMRGKRVERRFGWDTHGLPAELEAMRQLGLKTKDEIIAMGVEQFNAAARASVLKYTDEWRDYVGRMGRWVDFDHDYKTLEPDYMESVLWVFKQLFDRGLVYEGFRVLPYCWNDETPLSNHELRMDDDVYQMRQDPAVTVGFRITDGDLAGALVLVWTTTPWTLPSNLAVMVGPDIDYVVVESDRPTGTAERFVIAEARLAAYARELGEEPTVLQRLKGADLIGHHYTPPFSYFEGHEKAFRVVEADFVTTGDGTGLVHSAGAFGEDDMVVTDREGIAPVIPVGPDGKFTYPVSDYEGMLVFDANPHIIDDLKTTTRGEQSGAVNPGTVLLRRETYDHSYPHCWRCRNPLIYMAVSSWFVAVTQIKDKMLANNQLIDWVPGNVKDGQFGKWLANARDWSISRNRFWGSPIPVWKSDNPEYPRVDVYGSFAELERDFGVKVTDLHRPFVDQLTRPNPDDPTGQSTMRRVEDVLDVWFDSGSMPYGQVHYPFENAQWFEHHYPADFIVEYIGQTRGWFYTLHILASALFDRPAFKSVICHGIVLGSDGQKMSKSLRNYPDVSEVFDRDGADAMRWFLMSSPILRGGNLIVTEQGIREGVRQVLMPMWSSWYFFSLYANAAGYDAKWSTESTDVLDRYLLAKTRELVETVEGQLDAYDVAGACETTAAFVDVLTNWYIRRSRERFWAADGQLDEAAFDTLYTVLEVLCRVCAPLLPFAAEQVWRGLTGGRSVHLTDWPDAADLPADADLVAAMDRVRAVCSTTSALRKAENLRTRLPLSKVTVVVADPVALQRFSGLIADELNLKQVELLDLEQVSAEDFGLVQRLTVNARAAGPRLGKQVQQAIKGSKSGDWSVAEDGTVTSGGIELVEGEYTLQTVVESAGEAADAAPAMLPGGGFVVLDTQVTDELRSEGVARDVIRAVQQARRDAGLDVSDRISLAVVGDDPVWRAVLDHQGLIMGETLAVQLGAAGGDQELPGGTTVALSDGLKATVAVKKVSA